MIKEIEIEFVNNFVAKEMKERLIHELFSKKRYKALSRLAHDVENILNLKCMFNVSSQGEVLNLVRQNGNLLENAYIIGGMCDGKQIATHSAIEMAFNDCCALIIVFSSTMAFIKTEFESSSCNKYILKVVD